MRAFMAMACGVTMVLSAGAATANSPALGKVIASGKLDLSRGDAKVGSVDYKVSERRGELLFDERFALTHDGKQITWTATVTYLAGAVPAPLRARVDTNVEGRRLMRARVEHLVSKGSIRITGALTSPKDGKTTKHEVTNALPAGSAPLLYASTLWYLGPKFVRKAGALPILWAEFPDDLDAPIHVKNECTLIRKALPGGAFSLTVERKQRDEPLVIITFDKADKVTKVDFGKFTGTPAAK